jgi:DNA-binding CsgD family transcriptional regulator
MDGAAVDRLTERQKACLRLVAQGYTSKEIGRKLDLAPSTVDNHILTATQTISATNRGEAGRFLLSAETRQNLPRESLALAEPAISGAFSPSASRHGEKQIADFFWPMPPIGGQRNDLDATERTYRIFQISAVAFGTVTGLAVLIAGAFKLFS